MDKILKQESDKPMLPTSTPNLIAERVVQSAISASLPGGSTYQYFVSNPWEASMRQEFIAFVQAQKGSNGVALDDGVKLLRLLNARYTTRYPVVALPIVYGSAVGILHEHGWWNGQAPDLFQANDEEVHEMVRIVTEILARIAQHSVPQPLSLLTKWLHFCLPNTFAICDSQAVNSIQKCSDYIYNHLGPQSLARRQFRWVSIYEKGGRGYKGILNFYRLCGEAAYRVGLMDELRLNSQRLEDIQHQLPNCLNTKISALDVLDKHLWYANGNEQKLGIPTPA